MYTYILLLAYDCYLIIFILKPKLILLFYDKKNTENILAHLYFHCFSMRSVHRTALIKAALPTKY